MSAVNPVPNSYPRVMPHLTVAGAADAIDFYTAVLGAEEIMRMPMPDGTIAHAEIRLGDSIVMIGDPTPSGDPTPQALGGTPVALFVYLEDVDAAVERATARGASVVSAPENQFYGDRVAVVDDPFGHRWNLATHVEDVSGEEMQRRMAELMPG